MLIAGRVHVNGTPVINGEEDFYRLIVGLGVLRIEAGVHYQTGVNLKTLFLLLFFVFSASAETVFIENTELWTEIDRINQVLENDEVFDSATLEELFEQTVAVALSYDLSQQFEDLRTDAFETGDYSQFDSYADRASEAVTVIYMGESNAIGVNTGFFLDLCEPDSEAYSFFLVTAGGFYADGEMQTIGTAELPAWMVRSGSSSQARILPEPADEWLGYWESIRPQLNGYFLAVADQTMLILKDAIE